MPIVYNGPGVRGEITYPMIMNAEDARMSPFPKGTKNEDEEYNKLLADSIEKVAHTHNPINYNQKPYPIPLVFGIDKIITIIQPVCSLRRYLPFSLLYLRHGICHRQCIRLPDGS